MNREEIMGYIKRIEELELKLTGIDKETLEWLIFHFNECARLYNEADEENKELKLKLLEKKCSDKDVEYKEKIKLQNRIDKAIEYIEFQKNNPQYDNVWRKYECESLIEILKGEEND